MLKIKETKIYEVDGIVFATKNDAEKYLAELNSRKILVVSTGPDTTEGRYNFAKMDVYNIITKNEEHLMPGQEPETLRKITELILAEKMPMYDGTMGTIRLMKNYDVSIRDYSELDRLRDYCPDGYGYSNSNIRLVENDTIFFVDKIPYELDNAILHVKKLLGPNFPY